MKLEKKNFSYQVLLLLMLVCLMPGQTRAQGLNLSNMEDGAPVVIEADNGIEWRQKEKVYIATGNAVASRGPFSVKADTLKAYYEGDSGNNQVYRIEAIDNVYIKSSEHEGFAEFGTYEVESGVFRLTGDNLKIQTATDVLTAEDFIEYREKEARAIASGDARVKREQNTLRADLLTAFFTENSQGEQEISTVHADGNIVITTPQEVVRGQKGVYRVETGVAVLNGDVSITREDNKLNGQQAEVNLKTGVSKLLTEPGTGRVRGVFSPKNGS